MKCGEYWVVVVDFIELRSYCIQNQLAIWQAKVFQICLYRGLLKPLSKCERTRFSQLNADYVS